MPALLRNAAKVKLTGTVACVWISPVPYLTSLLMMRNKAMMENELSNAEPGAESERRKEHNGKTGL